MNLLQCPSCCVRLRCGFEQYDCPKCGISWPVKDGIPRFFQMPDHYWGEVDRKQALEMISAARRGSWVQAVCERFPERDNMRFGLLDLQRASWAPMSRSHAAIRSCRHRLRLWLHHAITFSLRQRGLFGGSGYREDRVYSGEVASREGFERPSCSSFSDIPPAAG